MPQVTTPLAQLLSPVRQQSFSPNPPGSGAQRGTEIGLLIKEARQKENLQRLSNLGQASKTGLDIISADPEKAESKLRDFIAQRKLLLPKVGITDMTDTNELEAALNEGGVPAAQELLTGALSAAQSAGFQLPPPTTPDFEQTFTAIGASGKPEIFFRSDQGAVPTGLLAPEKTPLVQVGAGGGDKERKAEFKTLFDESKNIDKTLNQFTQVRNIINEGGLGTIGTSGKVTKGIEKAFSAVGGLAKNFGLGSDEFDQGSIVSNALKGTPLGDQANRNAKVTSLITNLGFAVARAQGNQRITDKDFEAAIRTIGASADNPEQLAGVLNQFGNNLINQFETDVQRTSGAFGFTKAQNEALALKNIPGVAPFREQSPQQKAAPTGISATTKPADLTPEQAQELAKNDPDLLRQIIENAKRGQ